MANVDVAKLNGLVAAGFLTVRDHPDADLRIWNYTSLCQFKRAWTPETLMCRGLITDHHGTIVARPFTKFFNYEEHVGAGLPLPDEPFAVTEKLDGSLGILYFVNHVPYVATRGSFESEQAKHATALLHKHYMRNVNWAKLEKMGVTLLWEIVYPENRIVCDYGGLDELFLLAAVDNETGAEYDIVGADGGELAPVAVFPVVQHYDGITDVATIRDMFSNTVGTDQEGFVVRYKSGLRLKLKFEDYVRLHRILTGVNARNIWDLLRTCPDSIPWPSCLETLLSAVPEEFEMWARNTAILLLAEYDAIEATCQAVHKRVKKLPSRKEQALTIAGFEHKAVVFKMLDGQPYADIIWKAIRPEAERPFRNQDMSAE